MGQFQTIKAVMNGGIMTPIMDGRTDSEKCGTGFRVLENFLPRSYGGIFKRPGTKFGASGSDVTGCIRTIGINRAVGTNFILAFHSGFSRQQNQRLVIFRHFLFSCPNANNDLHRGGNPRFALGYTE